MLFRGQVYGAPVGEWWTTSLHEAEKFGMSVGGNRTYVVLSFDEDTSEPWLDDFRYASRATDDNDNGDWYRIPIEHLRKHWRGVRIQGGAISIEVPT